MDLTTRTELHHPTPGSRLLFPTLGRPTAPVSTREHTKSDTPDTPVDRTRRGLMMPRRKTTREQDRAKDIADQRRLYEPWAAQRLAERNKPPPSRSQRSGI